MTRLLLLHNTSTTTATLIKPTWPTVYQKLIPIRRWSPVGLLSHHHVKIRTVLLPTLYFKALHREIQSVQNRSAALTFHSLHGIRPVISNIYFLFLSFEQRSLQTTNIYCQSVLAKLQAERKHHEVRIKRFWKPRSVTNVYHKLRTIWKMSRSNIIFFSNHSRKRLNLTVILQMLLSMTDTLSLQGPVIAGSNSGNVHLVFLAPFFRLLNLWWVVWRFIQIKEEDCYWTFVKCFSSFNMRWQFLRDQL